MKTTYVCQFGHTFKGEHPGPFTMEFDVGSEDAVKIPVGPLCPYCIASFLTKNCSTREVTVSRVPPPLHVVFEGADACGKTTQVRLLRERFEDAGRQATAVSFPSYHTPVGDAISRHASGEIHVAETEETLDVVRAAGEDSFFIQAMHTFDRYAAAPLISYELAQGRAVVSSRWWQSSVIYGADSGIDSHILRSAHSLLPRAHLNVLLHLSEDESLRRRPDLCDLIERDRPKQERVRGAYLRMWEAESEADPKAWLVVGGDHLSEAEVHEVVWRTVLGLSGGK